MVYVLIDWENYVIASTVVFGTKVALEKYCNRVYGDLLKTPQCYIDWESGEVYKDKQARIMEEDPLAIFVKRTINY